MSRLWFTLFIALALPACADVYKWVDDNGKVHYSDTPPPTQTKQGVTQLSNQGMTIRQTEGILTPEQRAAKEAQAAKDREAQQKLQDQRRHDRALMNSFSNTAEIDEVRDRNIEAVQAAIASSQSRHEALQAHLNEYNKQAASYTTKKKPVPDDLASSISDSKDEIAKVDADIAQKKQDIEQIKSRAEDDKKRLVQLRSQAGGGH